MLARDNNPRILLLGASGQVGWELQRCLMTLGEVIAIGRSRTKLAGERAIQAVGGDYFIFRTSWVYGLRGQNFLLTLRRLAHQREELRIVEDQIGAPTWCRHIAEATAPVMLQIQRQPGRLADTAGVFHLTVSGRTSWYGFARAIVTASQTDQPLAVKRVLPIATADYPCPAQRPKNSLLDNSRIERTFGIRRPAWDEALSLCLA